MTFPLLGKIDKDLFEILSLRRTVRLVNHFSPLGFPVLLSVLSSIVPCSSSLFGCSSTCTCFGSSISFDLTQNMSSFSIFLSSASAGEVKSITSFIVLVFCFGLMAWINCTQALYAGVFFGKSHFLN